jgi:hypothetical protein
MIISRHSHRVVFTHYAIMHAAPLLDEGKIRCDSRLGGLLRHYHRAA